MGVGVCVFGDFLSNDFNLSKCAGQHRVGRILLRHFKIDLLSTAFSTSTSPLRFSSDGVIPGCKQ